MLTVLHAGGKFGDGGGYKVSGGLHGVGVSVVNALSEELELHDLARRLRVDADVRARQAAGELKKGAKTDRRGTQITFLPDLEIFETIEYDDTVLDQRFRETAFLTRGPEDRLRRRARRGREHSFQYDGGIVDFVHYLHSQGTRDPISKKVVYIHDESDVGEVEVAMQWNDGYQESLLSFANNINTHEGGTHLSGFRSALTRTLNAYARQKGELQGEGRQPLRRGRPRGPDRDHLGQARRAAVRGPDEDQARQPADGGLRPAGRQQGPRPSSSRRTRPRRARSSRRRSRRSAPARPRARRAT